MNDKTNLELVKEIIDEQVKKVHSLSSRSQMPMAKADADMLAVLVKILNEYGDTLNTNKQLNKIDELSPEELLIIKEHRLKKCQTN
ncbi:hypothetical protein [Fluviispira vulneris]|uniref:hypothetical protein n=1 Tax=Fluviispira vulneris TaxID=2763012 RepID=UPI0016496EF3|nr:hypothetical protein [Fluviispira vulneris]